jgi:hypothetical protein
MQRAVFTSNSMKLLCILTPFIGGPFEFSQETDLLIFPASLNHIIHLIGER